MLSVAFIYCYAERHCAECRSADVVVPLQSLTLRKTDRLKCHLHWHKFSLKNGCKNTHCAILGKTSTHSNQAKSDSVARWQHGSQICFATFILWKKQNLSITQQPTKLENK